MTYRNVKAEHQRPHGKMQPLDIPVWKYEDITMDFITKLTRTARGVDSIWGACLGGVRLRCPFHFQILEEVSRGYEYSSPFQHCFPPSDRQTEQEDDTDSRGHATRICVRFRWYLGYVSSVSGIFV